MKRALPLMVTAVAAIAVSAPALAQPYGPPGARYGRPDGWDIGRRIQWTQERIIRGRDSGALDHREFDRVQGELNGVRREAERTRYEEGGRIDERHRVDLEGKLDRINEQIHWMRDVSERRPW